MIFLLKISRDSESFTEADPEILKRKGALCQPSWLVGEKNFSFQMASKRKNEKLKISSFKEYRILKKVICKYF